MSITPENSEALISPNTATRLKKALAATTLALVAGGAGVATGMHIDNDSTPGISQKAAEAIANRAAYNAVQAERLADYYTQKANEVSGKGESLGVLQFVNGTVHMANGSSTPTEYRDLIVLSLNSDAEGTTYDSEGRFLDGAYLGVTSTDASGDVRVTVIPFTAAESTFEPYDAENPILMASAYVTQSKEGDDFMYATDLQQTQIMNPDSSVFSPTIVK